MSSSLARYESFLVKHVSTISTVESSLRSLTWFLPGRFKDAEMASEALSALLNVTSMYHDTLLATLTRDSAHSKTYLPSSLHNRYTTAWSQKDTRYKWIARVLQVIQYTELVVEMGLKRKASKARWRAVVLLEAVKAILRITLMRITRRPLLSPPIPEREYDPAAYQSSESSTPTVVSSTSSSHGSSPEHLKNNRIPLPPNSLLSTPTIDSETAVDDYLLPKALTTSSVKPSASLLSPMTSPQDWISESIYILRPLIYAWLYSSDRSRSSSRPLAIILVLELLSRTLRRTPPPSAALERSEYARRDKDMLWYLLRGPIWQSFTRPKLETFARNTARTPVIGLLGALVEDWIPLIDEYYYYTAP